MSLILDKFPEELRRSSRWVTWRLETVEGRPRCKVPKTKTGRNSDPINPDNWGTLEEALGSIPEPLPEYAGDPTPNGIGLVIGPPYVGVDLDDCLSDNGDLKPWAQEMLGKLPRTYTEVTPSGKGFHLWYRCDDHQQLKVDGIRTKDTEVYSRKRYFTVTGRHVPNSPTLLASLSVAEVNNIFSMVEARREKKSGTEKVTKQTNESFEEMMTRIDYPDLSVAVQSLLTKLAIAYTGNRKLVEEQFKKSLLYQSTHWKEKWERLGERELDLACSHAHDNIQKRIKGRNPEKWTKRAKLVELEHVKPQRLEWLWPDKVPLGNVTVFAGIPGVGKSLLALDLVGRGSIGATMLDKKDNIKPFKSLLLAIEDDRETILVPRLMGLGADLTKVRCLDMLEFVDDVEEIQDSRMLSLDSDLDVVRDVLHADPSYKLLVIDPLSNYMGTKSLYNDQEVRSILMPVVNLAQETGIAVVVVMHHSKQVGRSALEKIGISLGGVGTVRIAWSFFRSEDEVEVLCSKRNLGNFKGLKFTTESVDVEINGVTTGQARIKYLGESEASADEVLHTQEDPEEQKQQAAYKLLKALIPKGAEVPSQYLLEQADKRGIGRNVLQKAKFELGIASFKKAKVWFWRWMDESEQAPQQVEEPVEELF